MANFHVLEGAEKSVDLPSVRRIEIPDVLDALRCGFDDFWDKPSHYAFLALIYPIGGLILVTWSSTGDALQLVFPLMAGFALIGPLAALGLYEISRRRELGIDATWSHAFDVRNSPAIPAIMAVGAWLVVVFLAWLYAAQLIYQGVYGSTEPTSLTGFIADVLTTRQGWTLIAVGNFVGLLFALLVLGTTVIAFPLLLDRDVGAMAAIRTSLKVTLKNPVPILFWGLTVAVGLFVGSLPLLVGLAIVLPVFGHATWHLYRKTVDVPRPPETVATAD